MSQTKKTFEARWLSRFESNKENKQLTHNVC